MIDPFTSVLGDSRGERAGARQFVSEDEMLPLKGTARLVKYRGTWLPDDGEPSSTVVDIIKPYAESFLFVAPDKSQAKKVSHITGESVVAVSDALIFQPGNTSSYPINQELVVICYPKMIFGKEHDYLLHAISPDSTVLFFDGTVDKGFTGVHEYKPMPGHHDDVIERRSHWDMSMRLVCRGQLKGPEFKEVYTFSSTIVEFYGNPEVNIKTPKAKVIDSKFGPYLGSVSVDYIRAVVRSEHSLNLTLSGGYLLPTAISAQIEDLGYLDG